MAYNKNPINFNLVRNISDNNADDSSFLMSNASMLLNETFEGRDSIHTSYKKLILKK